MIYDYNQSSETEPNGVKKNDLDNFLKWGLLALLLLENPI